MTMTIPPALIQQAREGKVVLVLGAGASIGAVNPSGQKAPLGVELARMLSEKFLGGEFCEMGLATVAELSESETDLHTMQQFVREVFEPFLPAEFHKLLPQFKWHGIATLNYDLVLERAYSQSPLQRLCPVVSNTDRLEEIRRSETDLLYLKLHGCINHVTEPRIPLILTPDQYVTHKKGRFNLFSVLEDWARELPLVFIGTTLDDSDIRQVLINMTSADISRPRYYLVTPTVTDTQTRFWESKKITMISGTFEEFLQSLDHNIEGIARAVPVAIPSLPIFDRFNTSNPILSDQAQLLLTQDLEYVHAGLASEVVDAKDFYRGFTGGWAPILQDLDFPRDLADSILMDVFLDDDTSKVADLLLVRSPAGAGKSVFLRRLAWEAVKETDSLCVYANNLRSFSKECLSEISDYISDRLYLFVDNLADNVQHVEQLLEHARRYKISMTIVGAERHNEWNVACESLEPYVRQDYSLDKLSKCEIQALLDCLKKHDALGTLKKQSREEQVQAFEKQARSQLLVALHETTLGRPFEEIVKNEYDNIVPEPAQNMYLTVCTLHRNRIPVRAGLISRVHGITFTEFKDKFFSPLEHVVFTGQGNRSHDYEYRARHPHIAELVFRQVLPMPQDRYDRYRRIMLCLNVAYESDRRSFQDMISARKMLDIIVTHDLIEGLYSLAKEIAPESGHVYLQHSIYEMRRDNGNLNRAGDYLRKAESLLDGDLFIRHQMAELELRKAEKATTPIVVEKHLQEARKLLNPLLGKKAKSAHAYHTAYKIEHLRVRQMLDASESTFSEEILAGALKSAEQYIAEGLQRFPKEDYLIAAEAELASTIEDDVRAVHALERAVAINLRNPHTVCRLAKIYVKDSDYKRAMELLEKALQESPHEKKVNYDYARLLIETDGDADVIERHLRRAFTEGDNKYEAQYWYARQLYINNKIQDARDRFDSLGNQKISPMIRRAPQGEWVVSGKKQIETGRIKRLEQGFAIIQRDGTADTIFFPRNGNSKIVFTKVARGDRVRFAIAFNFHGPVAIDVVIEDLN